MTNTARQDFFDTPPLRYVGSKWQLSDWIIQQFPPHRIYVEPFCGGASVFFRKHRSPLEVLNDLDGDIINFFDVLRTRPDELLRAIKLTPYSRMELIRSFEYSPDPLEAARRFYVSVWQSFGNTLIYHSGWSHRKNANHRSNLQDIWRRMDGLHDAAHRLTDAQIECMGAVECIEHYDSPETLFYLDPPYVIKSRADHGRRRYRHEMENDEHRQLADVLAQVKGMVILSGYQSPLYAELFPHWTKLTKSTTTKGNGQANEVLWINPACRDAQLPMFKAVIS